MVPFNPIHQDVCNSCQSTQPSNYYDIRTTPNKRICFNCYLAIFKTPEYTEKLLRLIKPDLVKEKNARG